MQQYHIRSSRRNKSSGEKSYFTFNVVHTFLMEHMQASYTIFIFLLQVQGFSRGNNYLLLNSTITSSCTGSESTGIERKSAFIPVPPSTATYNSSMNLTNELFKRHQEITPDYPNPSYFNQLPPHVPPLSLHPYNM